MPNLILYYKPTCPYCVKVLSFMDSQGIDLDKKDVSSSSEIRDELIALGGKPQVPCLSIDGKALYESDDIIDWLSKNVEKS